MMPRVFWETPLNVGQRIVVAGDDGHHFARVLRAKAGERATVAANQRGYLAIIRSVDAGAGTVELDIVEELAPREAQHRVYLIQAVAKADKVETIVQKCTEIGIAGVLLYESARSVVKLNAAKRDAKLVRWNKVAKEAAIQCQRDTIPVVQHAKSVADIREFLQSLGSTRLLLLDEAEEDEGLRQVLRGWREARETAGRAAGDHVSGGETLAPGIQTGTQTGIQPTPAAQVLSQAVPPATVIIVGPEGGWDEDERAQWRHLHARPITLGPRILRTETAGLVATAAVLYEFGDLGG